MDAPAPILLSDPRPQPEEILVAGWDATATAPGFTRIVHVDPTAADGGDGSIASPFDSWADVVFEPGTVYLQRGGTTAPGFTVSVAATADAPVVIGSYGEGAARIAGTVVVADSSHVTLTGLDIAGGQGFGVHVQGAAADLTIIGCAIHHGLTGIYVEAPSIQGLAILANAIHDNDMKGVWLNGAAATAARPAVVAGNQVWRNGESGIALHASHVLVDGNAVVNNGLAGLPGTSGIHGFGVTDGDGMGWFNQVSNNLVAFQREPDGFDGHGIQLDHFSGQNTVWGNRVHGNDGPGITLFSSTANIVAANSLSANAADAADTRDGQPVLAEIFLGNAGVAPGLTLGNLLAENRIAPGAEGAVAVAVTGGAEWGGNVFGANLAGAGDLFLWGRARAAGLDAWNALGGDGWDDAAGGPADPLPAIDPAWLAPGYRPNSTLLDTPDALLPNRLVADAARPDRAGGAAADRIAGHGGANRIEGLGGEDLLAGGGGADTIWGGSGDDLVAGGLGDDLLMGGRDADLIAGGAGNDRLAGDGGDDWLSGGDGSDRLNGGAGDDQLRGGTGADIFVAAPGGGADLVLDFTPGEDRIDLRAFRFADIAALRVLEGPEATLIDLGGGGMVVLLGVAAAALGPGDIILG
ncbi:right-handed parallel beta-helix repeat-containing protein [Roseomonas sp. PWR1]|uniref:Right-handed parallel beta-helix repeat-containing protein n=1 Tax=Roseomonas nitratireducens TaxID=2820810 RepID=A0ABS4AVL6_9PROT|nr:right-handed parallel beta-helix repeat-containing protein [Neoroseomonas nitratireducens]MBP0465352.1 right-handed parallel beta-helix repeat-containing protein [Neoroseomonas nitratireducens]